MSIIQVKLLRGLTADVLLLPWAFGGGNLGMFCLKAIEWIVISFGQFQLWLLFEFGFHDPGLFVCYSVGRWHV